MKIVDLDVPPIGGEIDWTDAEWDKVHEVTDSMMTKDEEGD